MMQRVNDRALRSIIAVLALADGIIHFSLDFILFRGNFFGPLTRPGPRPGTAPGGAATPPAPRGNPFILPLNQLFLLNFIGALVLVLLFWFSRRWLVERRWLMDVVLIVYAAATFVAWWIFGRPNPLGLGYLSKGIEIVLIIACIVDIRSIVRQRGTAGQPA